MQTITRTPKLQFLLAGALAGQIAGAVMGVIVMAVFALFLDESPLYPLQVIGSLVYGKPALQGTHGGAIVLGLLIHQLGPSLFWGAVMGGLALAMNISSFRQTLSLGIAVGILSMLIDAYLLVPLVMNAALGMDYWAREVPLVWNWAAHLIFGLSLAIFPWALERMYGGAPRFEMFHHELGGAEGRRP